MDVPKPKTKKDEFKDCKNSDLFDIGRNMETTTNKNGVKAKGFEEKQAVRKHQEEG